MLKSRAFGDRSWERPCGVLLPFINSGVYLWGGLSMYWMTPYLICKHGVQAPAWLLALGVASFGFGVFFHFASDMQKHMHCALRPGTLLTSGLWKYTRNPNYFGELLIYFGFGSLAAEWACVPFLVLGMFLTIIWIPNMLRKEKSLSRYVEFASYKSGSALLIPFVV